MTREDASALADLLRPRAALRQLFDEIRAEVDGRAAQLINMNLADEAERAKAVALQGEIRGAGQVLERLEEKINEDSIAEL